MVHNRNPRPTPSVIDGEPVIGRASTGEILQLQQAQRWLDNPSEDLTVQQRVDSSAWHRRAIGGTHTACGKPIMGYGVPAVHKQGSLRGESYEGELCEEGCFSPWELLESARLNREAAERREVERRAWMSRFDDPKEK